MDAVLHPVPRVLVVFVEQELDRVGAEREMLLPAPVERSGRALCLGQPVVLGAHSRTSVALTMDAAWGPGCDLATQAGGHVTMEKAPLAFKEQNDVFGKNRQRPFYPRKYSLYNL